MRLARRKAGTWQRKVHEKWVINGQIGELSEPLHHFPHPDIKEFIEKINWYTELETTEYANESTMMSVLKLFLFPPAKFIVNYLIRLGLLDGFPGFVLAFPGR